MSKPIPVSDLPGVEYAAVYYEPGAKKGTNTPGRWVTVIRWTSKTGRHVNVDNHETEAAARAFVGLTGGSKDPEFHMTSNVDRREVAIDRSSTPLKAAA